MRARALLLFTAIAALAAGGASWAQGSTPPGAVRLQRAEIVDQNGFERPMLAATVFIPAGWQSQGGVVWGGQGTCGAGYQFNWSAASPDGAMGLAIFPGLQWGVSNFTATPVPGCPTLQLFSVQQYLQYLAQTSRAGARILDFRRRPDIEQDFAQLGRVAPMPMGEIRTWVEAGEVLLGYSLQGRETREAVAAAVIFTLTRVQGVVAGQSMDTLVAEAVPGYAFRAPDGHLDFRLAETVRGSIKLDPQWSARINQHQLSLQRTANAEARKRSQIISQSNAEISEMQRQSYEERNRIMDRQHREFSESIRGVETYNDPMSPTGTVELSNQYGHAWRLNDGTYVLSDQSDLNPYAVFGQDGTKLGPAR